MVKKNHPFLLLCNALLSGVLLWLSWPERGFTPLIFVSWVPLLYAEHLVSSGKIVRSGWKMFGVFYLSLLTWNTLTTWWIYNATGIGSIVAIGLNSLFMAFVWQLFFKIKKKQGSFAGYSSLIFFWIAFEYLHLNWDISWPWLTLGNAFATKPEWIQWYEFTGTLGGSFWILLVNLLIFQLVKNSISKDLLFRLRKINILILSGATLALLAGPVIFSLYLYRHHHDKGLPVKVVVVQPNIDPYNEKFNGTGPEQLAKLLRLASTVSDTSTEYIIGPETAIPEGIWEENISTATPIRTIEKYIHTYPKLHVILGLTSYKGYGKEEKISETARKFKDSDSYYDVYNSALQIDFNDSIQLYHKSRLVPGVEKMPYPKIFGFLEKYAIDLGGAAGSMGTQERRTNFVSESNIRVAPAICYESIYGDFIRKYILNGAQFITIITNDGWWGDTPGYRQHINYARLRAVEFRKSIARSANTGISCFINQRGDILQKSSWWTEDAMQQTLLRNDIVTFYAKHGDYIGFIAAFLSAGLLLFSLFRRLSHWF